MYKLNEKNLPLLEKNNLDSKYSIEFKEVGNIRFQEEPPEDAKHRTQVDVDLKFNFSNERLNFDIDDEVFNFIVKEEGLNRYFRINLKILIEAENTVFQIISLKKREYKRDMRRDGKYDEEAQKGIFSSLNLNLNNSKFNIIRINNSFNINLSHIRCNELKLESRIREIKIEEIIGKVFSLHTSTDSIALNNFLFHTFSISEVLKKISLTNGVIRNEIIILKSDYHDHPDGIFPDFKILFVNLKNATNTKIDVIRKIKKQLESVGNNYDYLNVRSCEYKITKKELSSFKKPMDFIQLWLNEKSNNFGTSWSRGVIFTIVLNLLGSLGLYYSIFRNRITSVPDLIPSNEFKVILFDNFSPIYKNDFLVDNNATFISYLILLITKIFVFYGIYQTVSAFRKYKK